MACEEGFSDAWPFAQDNVPDRCVACGRRTFANDAHVPSATRRQRHGLGEIASAVINVDVCARAARLRDFKYDVAPCKAVADTDRFLVAAKHGQVFTEAGCFTLQILFSTPPRPVARGISAHGLVGAAVYGAVGLRVALDAQPAEENRFRGNEGFSDCRKHRKGVALADEARNTAIHREKRQRHRLTFFQGLLPCGRSHPLPWRRSLRLPTLRS